MIPVELTGGLFLGWAVGRNDTANIFGPAVATSSIRYRNSLLLCALFVVAGGLVGSGAGFETLAGLSGQTVRTAIMASIASALTITVMTIARLPASISQIAIGSIAGIGFMQNNLDLSGMEKILVCWALTPLLGAFFAVIASILVTSVLSVLPVTIFGQDIIVRSGLVIAGCYGAYALGANNAAGITSVFVTSGLVTPFYASIAGCLAMAIGTIFCRKSAMYSMGQGLVRLDPASALVVVLAEAATVHFFAFVGVPVSTSQALTGAMIGLGFLRGMQTIRFTRLLSMLAGWIVTPAFAFLLVLLLGMVL